MGFFDLNVPYLELSPSSDSATATAQKTNRVKTVIKAMELGYTGVAYNRTIKGVMSDRDRCSIQLLSLSSLLKLAPFLSSSVDFHLDLLGVPRTSPFRQYTRLTVCVDSSAQSQALNSGNPVLKSYDIVSVRPLNQNAFDHACEKADVDIISIDFSDKLPFRLRQSMIGAAIKRGVYFEIVYSDLIVDVQVRRQMISNSKLLVVWARGKNIIISSAAPSVCELRGPNDVANLVSLLGLSLEQAKAAISKNCRNLISSALRRKHFYKEAIKVEHVSSADHCVSGKSWSADWLKWDPLSSAEGDLLLDNMANAFSASSKASNTVKAIDFASVIDSTPSQGFQVTDFVSRPEGLSYSLGNNKLFSSIPEADKVFVQSHQISEPPSKSSHLSGGDKALLGNTASDDQNMACDDSSKVNLLSDLSKHFVMTDVVETQKLTMEKGYKSKKGLDLLSSVERCAMQKETGTSGHEKNEVLQAEIIDDQESNPELNLGMLDKNVTSRTVVRCIELGENLKADSSLEVSAPYGETSLAGSQSKDSQVANNKQLGLVVGNDRMDSFTMDMDMEDLKSASLHSLERTPYIDPGNTAIVPDPTSSFKCDDEIRINADSAAANTEAKVNMMITCGEMNGNMTCPSSPFIEPSDGNLLEIEAVSANENGAFRAGEIPVLESSTSKYGAYEEVSLEVRNHEGHDTEMNDLTPDLDAGRARGKRRASNQVHQLPFMRFLRPVSSKKKAKIHRRR